MPFLWSDLCRDWQLLISLPRAGRDTRPLASNHSHPYQHP